MFCPSPPSDESKWFESRWCKTFPGRWDVSCAGHISGKDGSLDSAVRELEEELGLSVDSALMESAYVATIPSSVRGSTPKHGDFDCREFQDIYLLRLEDVLPNAGATSEGEDAPSPLDQLTLGAGEVADVALLNAEGVLAAWAAEDDGFVPRPAHYCETLAAALQTLESR